MFLFPVPVGAFVCFALVHVYGNEQHNESQEEMARRKLCDPNPQLQPELSEGRRSRLLGISSKKASLSPFNNSPWPRWFGMAPW